MEATLSLEEIKASKRKAEQSISDALIEYQQETGLQIQRVEIVFTNLGIGGKRVLMVKAVSEVE